MPPRNLFARIQPMPVRPIMESYWVIPGRLLAGEHPTADYSTEGIRRRIDSFLECGFNTYIDLTGNSEIDTYSPMLIEQAGYQNIQVECMRFPIIDFGLPSRNLMNDILKALDNALVRNRKIYLHCYGGIGRTGTTVGCFLVRHGLGGRQAVQELASWWSEVPKSARHPVSPETSRQKEFILSWSEE